MIYLDVRIAMKLMPTVEVELDSCIIGITHCTCGCHTATEGKPCYIFSGSQTHVKLLKEVTFTILVILMPVGSNQPERVEPNWVILNT